MMLISPFALLLALSSLNKCHGCFGPPPCLPPPSPPSRSPNCHCGVGKESRRVQEYSTTFIVNGTNATKGEFPWQVALVFNSNSSTFCGGMLLSSDTVLTAAHCKPTQGLSTFKVILSHISIGFTR